MLQQGLSKVFSVKKKYFFIYSFVLFVFCFFNANSKDQVVIPKVKTVESISKNSLNNKHLSSSHTPSLKKKKKFRILAIDGGGIRGVVAARLIKEIEMKVGKPISGIFDLIVGTSTGGIISIGLAIPNDEGNPRYSAENIIDIYRNFSTTIFGRTLWHKIITGWGVWGPKYDRENMDKILFKIFSNVRMSDLLTNVLCVCFSLDSAAPQFLSVGGARKNPALDFFARDVAAATSAAPTYFSPKRFSNVNETSVYNAVDGGLFANSPIMAGVIEAFKIAEEYNEKININDIMVVSIGTGQAKVLQSIEGLSDAGALKWVLKAGLIDIIINATTDFDDLVSKTLLKKNYCRFQIALRDEVSLMDDIKEEHIETIISETERYIIEKDTEIKQLVDKLKEQPEKYFRKNKKE